MDLLLITSRWPYGEVTEFLDDEIHHLARTFDRVVVAPMRPKGHVGAALPAGVVVDDSLAESLERSRLTGSHRSRRLTAAVRTATPSRRGLGATRGDLLRDGSNWSWLRTSLLSRADVETVAGWAARSPVPDLAYTFWLGGQTVGLRAAWPRLPLVSRVHRAELYAEAHGWRSIPFQAAGVKAVDLLAPVSEDGRRYLVDRHPGSASRIVVRRLGVRDLGSPRPRVPHDSLRALSASSIIPVKRVDLILTVVHALAASGVKVEWTHLGDGPGRAQVELAAAQAPGSLTVHLEGHVPLERVHQELQSGNHDVFVNLSLSEGAPVSLMEAQCVGLPVVATDVGGTSEVVPGDLNELVGPGDPVASLREAVLRAARRPPQEAVLRRELWAQRYSAEVNYAAWAHELVQLASRSPGPR